MENRAILSENFTPTHNAGIIALTPSFSIPFAEMANWVNNPYSAGAGASQPITFSGNFVAGDEIRISLHTSSGDFNPFRKSYSYIVQSGDTVTKIAEAFVAKINYMPNGVPFLASNSAGVLTITGKSLDVDFVTDVYNTSASGVVTKGTYTEVTEQIGTRERARRAGIELEFLTEDTHDEVVFVWTPKVSQPELNLVADRPTLTTLFLSEGEGASFVTLLNGL